MTRALISVVFVCVLVGMAAAGVPDPDQSYVQMDNGGKGLSTCPAGDGGTYQYIHVYALRADGSPIQGIASGNFFFSVSGAGASCCSIVAADAETDVNGHIRFEATGTCSIPYGDLTIGVTIYSVVINDSDTLTCNTVDYDDSGAVDPIDFSAFASDFGTTNESSDFDWNGSVDPIDFSYFAGHFGH